MLHLLFLPVRVFVACLLMVADWRQDYEACSRLQKFLDDLP